MLHFHFCILHNNFLKGELANFFYWLMWCPQVWHYLEWKRKFDWSLLSRDIDVQRVFNISGTKLLVVPLFSVQIMSYLVASDIIYTMWLYSDVIDSFDSKILKYESLVIECLTENPIHTYIISWTDMWWITEKNVQLPEKVSDLWIHFSCDCLDSIKMR